MTQPYEQWVRIPPKRDGQFDRWEAVIPRSRAWGTLGYADKIRLVHVKPWFVVHLPGPSVQFKAASVTQAQRIAETMYWMEY